MPATSFRNLTSNRAFHLKHTFLTSTWHSDTLKWYQATNVGCNRQAVRKVSSEKNSYFDLIMVTTARVADDSNDNSIVIATDRSKVLYGQNNALIGIY